MTSKELLYVEDALGHEKFFGTRCTECINQISDPELKKCVENISQKHSRIFQNLYGLLGGTK